MLSYEFVKHSILFTFASSLLLFPFSSLLLHFMCFSFIECTALWIPRFFKGALSRSKRDHGCAVAWIWRYVPMYVWYLTELVRERDIELRSHTWRQTDDASDRLRKFRSLCIYTRFFGLRAARGVGTGTGMRRNVRVPKRNFQIMIHWEGGCAPRVAGWDEVSGIDGSVL